MPRTTKKPTTPIEKHTIPTVPVAEQPYQVPENWRWVRLGDVCIFENGYAFKSQYFSPENGVPVIRISDITDNEVNLNNTVKTTETNVDDRFVVYFGDLLIAMSGATTGKNGIYYSTEKAFLNQRVGNIKINQYKYIISKYRNYLILNKTDEILRNAYGGAQPNISSKKICMMPIPLPPLAEQQRIVDRIERLFAKLDEAREKAQAVVDSFENRKAAILHQAFTGELTKKWREERGIGMESWKRIPLAELCERIFDGPFGSNLKTEDYVDSGIRVVRLENIKNLWFDDSKQSFVTKEKYRTIENHTVYPTDLIMATFISDEIKICQMPSYIGYAINKSDCVGIRLKESIIHRYVLFYLSSKDVYNILLKNIHGATRPRVNTKQIKSIIIPTASLVEQTIIVQEIEKLFSQERRARDLAESVIAQIDGMKKAILARAFRGELGTNVPGEAACESICNNNH